MFAIFLIIRISVIICTILKTFEEFKKTKVIEVIQKYLKVGSVKL
jgi:hypothetical protein